MIYLGIDFGLKHIGLSIADGPLAAPLTQKTYSSEEELLQFLVTVIQDQQVNVLVIGLPEGNLASTIKSFGSKLTNLTNLEVHYQDETLSTIEAKQKLLEAHAPQKKRSLDHQAAATLILQSYLDDHHKA